MTTEETVKRKIKLNGQAVKLIREEKRELVHLQNLLKVENFLQSKVSQEFDQSLSSRLDAIRFLIESFDIDARSQDLYGDSLQIPGASPLAGRDKNGKEKTD